MAPEICTAGPEIGRILRRLALCKGHSTKINSRKESYCSGTHQAPPAQLVFGKPMRECLLAHRRSFAPEWQQPADVLEKTDPALKGKQGGALQPDHTGAAIASNRLAEFYVDSLLIY